MYGQPEQIVDSRRYSRTQIRHRTVPFIVKDVLHQGLSEPNQAFLSGEVPNYPVVEDDDVFLERVVQKC